jgi:hypothetical protein
MKCTCNVQQLLQLTSFAQPLASIPARFPLIFLYSTIFYIHLGEIDTFWYTFNNIEMKVSMSFTFCMCNLLEEFVPGCQVPSWAHTDADNQLGPLEEEVSPNLWSENLRQHQA